MLPSCGRYKRPTTDATLSLFRTSGAAAVLGFMMLACARDKKPGQAPETLGAPDTQVFGGATQELEDRGLYVYCRVTGPGTVFGGVSGMKQVFKYASANNRHRILLDLWKADMTELSTPEVIAGTFGLLPFWDWGTRISVLMPAEALPKLVNRFSFPVGKIRLIKLRRFDKMEDAEAWLLRDD